MSSNQLKQAFSIKFKSSLTKQLLIVLSHVIVIAIFFIFIDIKGLTAIYFLMSILCIAISLIYFVRLHLTLKSNKSVFTMHKDSNDSWSLTLRENEKVNVSISATSFSSNLLIILNFKDEFEKQYTSLITPDSVTHDEFRKLKVYIKTKKLDA